METDSKSCFMIFFLFSIIDILECLLSLWSKFRLPSNSFMGLSFFFFFFFLHLFAVIPFLSLHCSPAYIYIRTFTSVSWLRCSAYGVVRPYSDSCIAAWAKRGREGKRSVEKTGIY